MFRCPAESPSPPHNSFKESILDGFRLFLESGKNALKRTEFACMGRRRSWGEVRGGVVTTPDFGIHGSWKGPRVSMKYYYYYPITYKNMRCEHFPKWLLQK